MPNEPRIISLLESKISRAIEELRPPVEIRHELDVGYTFKTNTLEVFEIRPYWDNPQKITHTPVAKVRYIKSSNIFKIYWMRGNLKWYPYDPAEVKSIEEFFQILEKDEYGCFWG
ncbi:MAG: DUF3024 domain-containing protein [Bacteroidales bacterium]